MVVISSSEEEGEILAGPAAPTSQAAVPRGITRGRDRAVARPGDRRRRPAAADPRSVRARRRSRSRSWSRSPSPSPRNGENPANGAFSGPPELAEIHDATQAVALADCLRDLRGVCQRLDVAILVALSFLDSSEGSAEDSGFRAAVARIHGGLGALNVWSSTGRGAAAAAVARPVVRRAWDARARLFSEAERQEMEKWRETNRRFRELVEDPPPAAPPRPRPPPPAPAEKQAVKEPAGEQGTPTVSGGVSSGGGDALGAQGTDIEDMRDQLSPTERRMARTAAEEERRHRELLSSSQEGAPGRNPIVDELLSAGKLVLVLDLDHTLLHSAMYTELGQAVGVALEARAAAEATAPLNRRSLFRVDSHQMFTKLRPGVREFLSAASSKFELWIHTNGNAAYASVVVPLLDPDGALFGGRIIAQGAANVADMRVDQPKALAHGLEAREAITAVVDDSHAVWQAHKASLVTIERYLYFPSTRAPPSMRGASLMERHLDENPKEGNLAATLALLERVHAAVFAALRQEKGGSGGGGGRGRSEGDGDGELAGLARWDVRRALATERKKVLAGTVLAFSRLIPLGQDPTTHELWRMATAFGARCSASMGPEVTHLVAADGKTEKAAAARAAGTAVVSPAWLTGSCQLWRRLDEYKFPVS